MDKDNEKYLIIPACSDLNRGDQALTWETARLAREAGFTGDYYIMSEDDDTATAQSRREGFKIFEPLLKHPSRFSKSRNNIRYGLEIRLKWGITALRDFLIYGTLLINPKWDGLISSNGKETLKLYRESNAIFVKGGGFIHGYGGIVSFYYIFYMLYHIMLAHRLKKPVYVMPNSFGPFEGPFVKTMVSRTLKKCKIVSSREGISANMLKEHLAFRTNVMPDLGFFLNSRDKSEMKNYMLEKGIPIGEKKCVAITMRPYRFPNSSNPTLAYENYKNAFVEFVKFLSKEGYHIVFVEHVLSPNTHEDDGSSIREIQPLLNDVDHTLISDKSLDGPQLKSIYSQCDFIVGTRFHSVIFSLSEGVPAIAVTYGGNKGNGIMQDMDLSEYAIPIDEVTQDKLKEKFISLNNNYTKVKSKMEIYLNNAKNLRNELINNLKN